MAVETHLEPAQDAQGFSTFGYRVSNHVDALVLAAGSAESSTKPTGARFLRICATNDVWVKPDGTAVEPAADIADGSASTLIPGGSVELIPMSGIAAVSFLMPAGGKVSLAYYK